MINQGQQQQGYGKQQIDNSQYQVEQISVQQMPLDSNQQIWQQQQQQQQQQQFQQGIPVNQFQQPYQYQQPPLQQYPQQQVQIQVMTFETEQQQQFAKISHICREYRKMCECWMYVLSFLLVIIAINLAIGSGTYENGLFYVAEIITAVEYLIWLYGTYLGVHAIKHAQIDNILTGNKCIYASVPFQIVGSVLKIYVYFIVEGEAMGMLFGVLFLIIEVYMGYYKVYKYVPLSKQIYDILAKYNQVRGQRDPTLQQLLLGNIVLNNDY